MASPDEEAREAERQRRIADACTRAVDPTGRLGLYRRLIQGNLAAVSRRLLPRTAAHLDRVRQGAFAEWFARFLAEAGPRTPYLRDVPVELVAWATPLWAASPDLPAFLADLARHEVDLFLVESAPRDASPPSIGEVSMERPLAFATPRRLARYAYAVSAGSLDPSVPPAASPTCLLIHRDDDNTVYTTVIEPPWEELLVPVLEGAPLRDALSRAAVPRPWGRAAADPERALATWLAWLGERGVLLGAKG